MAAIKNLELAVEVDIASAITNLEKLQEELQDVAESIEAVDAVGTDGIDIRTSVDDASNELSRVVAETQAADAATSIDIPVNADRLPMHILDWDKDPDIPNRVGDLGIGDSGAIGSLGIGDRGMRHSSIPVSDFDFGGGRGDGNIFRSLRRKMSNLGDEVLDTHHSMRNFDLRMSDLHNLLAALVPLLVVFLGAIPAAATALIGLAAAAGAAAVGLAGLAGLGAMGLGMEDGEFQMENLQEAWQDIVDDFTEAFTPLAESLQPLFEDLIDGLGRFFEAIARRGSAIQELSDDARAFGSFVMDFVPQAIASIAALAEALGPALGNVADFIDSNFNYFMRELVRLTEMALPVVSALAQTLWNAIPTIIEISVQFARVANIVALTIGMFWNLITLGGILSDFYGLVVAGTLAALSAIVLLNKAVGFLITQLSTGLVASLAKVASGLWAYFTSATMTAQAQFALTQATYALKRAFQALLSATVIGLVLVAIGELANAFLGTKNNIDAATDSLREFDRVAGRMEGGMNPYAEAPDPTGAANLGSGGSGKTVINIETTGDQETDKSNAQYAGFRMGRTSGGSA